jgi:tetratricopeptide (TPR) repeat protein
MYAQDLSGLWDGLQTELIARRRLWSAYGVFLPGHPHKSLPCVIHSDNRCVETKEAVLHHLDEMGFEGEGSWFFENLVPICGGVNDLIQHARAADLRKELISTNQAVGASALSRLYDQYQTKGQLLFAYAAARLGAFLVASEKDPKDTFPMLDFATKCLWTLRGIEPRLAVPLAADTMERSVLAHVKSVTPLDRPLAIRLADLAAAVGSIHREFGDVENAKAYFNIALRLADFARLEWFDDILVRLVRNIRVLVAGTFKIDESKRLIELIKTRSKYDATRFHEGMHLLMWTYRQNGDDGQASRRDAAEAFEEAVKDLNSRFYDLKYGAGIADPDTRLKTGVLLSQWDATEMRLLLADALATFAEGDPNGTYGKDAKELMSLALQAQKELNLSMVGLARPRIFETLLKPYENDDIFRVEFREPTMLARICERSAGYDPIPFTDLSQQLFVQLRDWIGAEYHVLSPHIIEVQGLL